jgi:hypothetical protein
MATSPGPWQGRRDKRPEPPTPDDHGDEEHRSDWNEHHAHGEGQRRPLQVLHQLGIGEVFIEMLRFHDAVERQQETGGDQDRTHDHSGEREAALGFPG